MLARCPGGHADLQLFSFATLLPSGINGRMEKRHLGQHCFGARLACRHLCDVDTCLPTEQDHLVLCIPPLRVWKFPLWFCMWFRGQGRARGAQGKRP